MSISISPKEIRISDKEAAAVAVLIVMKLLLDTDEISDDGYVMSFECVDFNKRDYDWVRKGKATKEQIAAALIIKELKKFLKTS